MSYWPVIELLKGYFTLQDRDDLGKIRDKVTGKLLALDASLQPALPALLALLEVPEDDAAWQTLEPAQRRQRTLDAVKRLLLREARERPLLLLVEDLHWMDAESQALLDSLVESLPGARVLLLVTYRREYQHGWGQKSYYTQLRLDPLPPAGVDELLHVLLGEHPSVAPLTRLLIERAEGNPFFLEEGVRALVETRVLGGERGHYHVAKDAATLQIPATVQAVLAARIDRLAPAERHLLQTAAVIGVNVPSRCCGTLPNCPRTFAPRSNRPVRPCATRPSPSRMPRWCASCGRTPSASAPGSLLDVYPCLTGQPSKSRSRTAPSAATSRRRWR
jgi:predicted ATPase